MEEMILNISNDDRRFVTTTCLNFCRYMQRHGTTEQTVRANCTLFNTSLNVTKHTDTGAICAERSDTCIQVGIQVGKNIGTLELPET